MNPTDLILKALSFLFAKPQDQMPPSSGGSTAAQNSIKDAQNSVNTINQNVTLEDVNKATITPPPTARYGFACEPRVTSNFGWRVLGGQQWHPGVDFASWMKFGAPVKAPESGTIILVKVDPSVGCTFVAIKGDFSNGYHYLIHTGTADDKISTMVKVGDHVKTGQVVGYTNHTGFVTGPHVHHAYYTSAWQNVDVVRCFYKKFAPELYAQITYYTDQGQMDPSNKSGHCCGNFGD